MSLHERIGKALGQLGYVNIEKSGVVDAPETYGVDTIGEYVVSHVDGPSRSPLPNIKRDLRTRFGNPDNETAILLSYIGKHQSVMICTTPIWLRD